MDSTIAIIVSVLAVGVGLATLIITMIRGLRRDLDARIDGLGARMDGLDARVRTLESALARLTGLLEGLGLTGRARPEPDPGPAD
jgi:hypothetical protein